MNKKDAATSTLISENPSETANSCKGNIGSEDKGGNESPKELRQKYLNCPIIAELNVNLIRNKCQFLKKEVHANMDILLILETKLDGLFPSAQFLLDGFSKLYTLDRCLNGGGILLCNREDILSRLLLDSNKTESIFAEINFRKKKCLICAFCYLHKSKISNHLHHSGKGLNIHI